MQAINAFCGGSLVQDLAGHQGPEYEAGPACTHPLSVVPGTQLAAILQAPGDELIVNSYHHQGIVEAGLAQGLAAAAHASHAGGLLVEGLESTDPDRFLVGIQCHPERVESTPAEFERLFRAFVEASTPCGANRL
jgi:putative glutamine amidotransferase